VYTYFKQKGDILIFKQKKYFNLIIVLIIMLVAIAYSAFSSFENFAQDFYWLTWLSFFNRGSNWIFLFALIMFIIINVAMFGRRVGFKPSTQLISISYFGFFKKEIPFNQFKNFNVVRRLMLGMFYSGTDIKMSILDNNKLKQITLCYSIKNTKKVQLIIEEVEQILKLNNSEVSSSISARL